MLITFFLLLVEETVEPEKVMATLSVGTQTSQRSTFVKECLDDDKKIHFLPV